MVLETTGHESTSARLQIRSLPKFCSHPGSWDEEETHAMEGASTMRRTSPSMTNQTPAFEVEAINIESELTDEENVGDYEMLPSPGPSKEHCVLNATISKDQELHAYGTSEQLNETDSVLGSIRVADDIGKLGDIICSVNSTLNKLHQASTQTTRQLLDTFFPGAEMYRYDTFLFLFLFPGGFCSGGMEEI